MKSPGLTVRPLVQITGEKGFNQVFFEDVKVPKTNLVGQKNQGWLVAMTNMMFERTIHGGRTDMMFEVRQLQELAAKVERNGRPAWEDRYVRQRVANFACEAEALEILQLSPAHAPAQGSAAGSRGLGDETGHQRLEPAHPEVRDGAARSL